MPGKKAIAFAGGRRLEKLIVDFRKNALSDTDLLNGFGDVVSQIDQDAMNEQRVRDLLYELLTPFVRVAKAVGLAQYAITTLEPLMTILQKSAAHVLTVVHVNFVSLCADASLADLAMPYIEHTIYEVSPQKHALSAKEYLEYFYYAGQVCARTKHFGEACEMLRMCFIIPRQQGAPTSKVQLLAYRLYALCSLLAYGALVPIKESVISDLSSKSKPFTELIAAFRKRDEDSFKAIVTKHEALFEESQTGGLVQQVGRRIVNEKIKQLTATYLKLTLDDIASICGLESKRKAEYRILHMIESGDIRASIDQKQGVVSFGDDYSHDPSSPEMADHLAKTVREVKEVNKVLRTVDNKLRLDKNYRKASEYGMDDMMPMAPSSDLQDALDRSRMEF